MTGVIGVSTASYPMAAIGSSGTQDLAALPPAQQCRLEP
jgi:hypothetical protein